VETGETVETVETVETEEKTDVMAGTAAGTLIGSSVGYKKAVLTF
jgi:hypothetical protein